MEMRIAQFVSHYPYAQDRPGYFAGGTGEVVRGLSLALARRGHEVRVYAVSADGRDAVEVDQGVIVHRRASVARVAQANLSLSILWQEIVGADVVHAHAGNPPAPLAALWAAKRRRVPLVLTYHGDPQPSYGSPLRRLAVWGWTLALRRLLGAADALTCPSEGFLSSSRYLGPHLGRVRVLPNGVDLDALSWEESPRDARAALGLPTEGRIVLFLGSLSPYKRPDLVVRAAAEAPADAGTHWVIAGDGAMRRELVALARALGVTDRVTFLGHVAGERKLRALAAADLFVLPSTMTTEVFPIALLEAAAMGLPAITSDLPTFRTVVCPGRTGLLTPRGDWRALGEAVRHLLSAPERLAAMGRAARAMAEAHSWDRIASEYEQLYAELVGGAAC